MTDHTPLSPERLAQIREGRYRARTLASADCDIDDLLGEVDRLRAERDEFADRVDTLTAVAKGNKRHVQELYRELNDAGPQVAAAERRAADLEQRVGALTARLKNRRAEVLREVAAQDLFQPVGIFPVIDETREEIAHELLLMADEAEKSEGRWTA